MRVWRVIARYSSFREPPSTFNPPTWIPTPPRPPTLVYPPWMRKLTAIAFGIQAAARTHRRKSSGPAHTAEGNSRVVLGEIDVEAGETRTREGIPTTTSETASDTPARSSTLSAPPKSSSRSGTSRTPQRTDEGICTPRVTLTAPSPRRTGSLELRVLMASVNEPSRTDGSAITREKEEDKEDRIPEQTRLMSRIPITAQEDGLLSPPSASNCGLHPVIPHRDTLPGCPNCPGPACSISLSRESNTSDTTTNPHRRPGIGRAVSETSVGTPHSIRTQMARDMEYMREDMERLLSRPLVTSTVPEPDSCSFSAGSLGPTVPPPTPAKSIAAQSSGPRGSQRAAGFVPTPNGHQRSGTGSSQRRGRYATFTASIPRSPRGSILDSPTPSSISSLPPETPTQTRYLKWGKVAAAAAAPSASQADPAHRNRRHAAPKPPSFSFPRASHSAQPTSTRHISYTPPSSPSSTASARPLNPPKPHVTFASGTSPWTPVRDRRIMRLMGRGGRGTMRTPSKEIVSSLDRAIDDQIEAERSIGGWTRFSGGGCA
ncbi:hypothetical protein K504DRAFT_504167 [Pleomassaria siparia CBS 279.74]|uniref:Uncharacterized protein n=1 Tax=Pleomassaria siparia CBS 279.74 TaxID=1314801 RepID=A0A6G1K673_9PLEO|nr:hypothetical protein K504DRAFT_504167 [Pleomassaria siparia CBS 279.74]